jgi:hypothetical protein
VGVAVRVAVRVELGLTVGVGVGVAVRVPVGVGVGVPVRVAVGVSVGVALGVAVRVAVRVAVGVAVGVRLRVSVGVAVALLTGVALGVLVGVQVLVPVLTAVVTSVTLGVAVGTAAQPGLVMLLLSRVTVPPKARARPSTIEAEVTSVMEVTARMLPCTWLPPAMVAEEPTTQKTWPAVAPLISDTTLLAAVMKVVVALKMKTALVLPPPSRTTVPVNPKVPAS